MLILSGIMFLMYRFHRLAALLYIRHLLRHRSGAKRRAGALLARGLRPMREAGAPSTEEVVAVSCARPTGGSHGSTTDDPAQRFKGAKRRPRQVQWGNSAAKGIIKAGAFGLRPGVFYALQRRHGTRMYSISSSPSGNSTTCPRKCQPS
jgi:hypothetical protein